MPIRFSTQAANADHMGTDADPAGTPEPMPNSVGADGTPRDRGDRTAKREPKGGAAGNDPNGAAKPDADPS